jgi:hypothetical protein
MYVGKKEKEVRKDKQTGDHMTNFSLKKKDNFCIECIERTCSTEK